MTAMVLGTFHEGEGDGDVLTYDSYPSGGSGAFEADYVLGAFTGVFGLPATIESREDFEALGLAMLVKDTEINDAGVSFEGLVSRTFLGIGGGGGDVFKVSAFEGATVYGRGGDDRISIFADANDSLNGGDGADLLYGAGGDKTLVGWAGDDTLMGGAGAETLLAGAGVDTLDYQKVGVGVVVNLLATGPQETAGGGVDVISGFENLRGSGSGDDLAGDDGANRIEGGGGHDTLWGGGGADTLAGGANRNRLNGGPGDDLVSYADATAGMAANLADHFASSLGDPIGDFDIIDQVEGLIGSAFADQLSGDAGRNTLLGGDGDDLIAGLGDVDVLDGAAGDDTVGGGAGDDIISGADGADILTGGEDDDTLIGGAGRDTADYRSAAAGVTVSLSAPFGGQDTGGAGVDDLLWIESLLGSAFRDVLTGDAEDNRLDGRGGRDALFGGFGVDTLTGAAGKDVLTGGLSGDVMTGGVGKDRYVYASLAESQKVEVDLITDLEDEDRILLTEIDANPRKAGNQAFDLVDALTGKAGQATLVYDEASDRTRLLLDSNGDAKADGTILLAGDHADFINFAL